MQCKPKEWMKCSENKRKGVLRVGGILTTSVHAAPGNCQIVKSRLLWAGGWLEADPICPVDLTMEGPWPQVDGTQFEMVRPLVRRLRMISEVKAEFRDKWVMELFSSLVKQTKWTKFKWNTRFIPVVLRRNETAAENTINYAWDMKVQKEDDMMVR